MFPPAVMIKLTEPGGDLYTILAVSDEDISKANICFISRDLPYRIRRISKKLSSP
jgi:hypothetical protein